jgi:hypothetical protein
VIYMKPIDAAWNLLKAADFRDKGIRDAMREQAMLADYTARHPEDNSGPLMPIESDIPMNVMQLLADEDLREAIYGKELDDEEVGEITHQLRGQRLNQFTPNIGGLSSKELRERAGSINPRTDVRVRGGYPYQEYPMSPTMTPPPPEL